MMAEQNEGDNYPAIPEIWAKKVIEEQLDSSTNLDRLLYPNEEARMAAIARREETRRITSTWHFKLRYALKITAPTRIRKAYQVLHQGYHEGEDRW